MPRSAEWSLSFRLFNQKFCTHFSSPHAYYMPCPSNPSWYDHPNNIWWRVQIMQLFIVLFFPSSFYFLSLRSKYSPQHPVFKHPRSLINYNLCPVRLSVHTFLCAHDVIHICDISLWKVLDILQLPVNTPLSLHRCGVCEWRSLLINCKLLRFRW
jgi:hypothetical protein